MSIDQQLLLWFNGGHTLFLDGLMTTLTSGLVWIPLYISLLYLVFNNHEKASQFMLTIGCVLACVIITAGITNLLVKPLVGRPRPCSDIEIKYLVDVVNGVRLNDYSFFSAHAANTLGLAVFMVLLVRNTSFTLMMIAWSLINCYTRLYLGYHYPSDILCGLLFGGVVGFLVYIFYFKTFFLFNPDLNYVSSHYTSTGYSVSDVNVTIAVFSFTLVFAAIRAVFVF